MKKETKNDHYKSPLQSPWAHPKKAYQQMNGETQQSLHNYILAVETRKRT